LIEKHHIDKHCDILVDLYKKAAKEFETLCERSRGDAQRDEVVAAARQEWPNLTGRGPSYLGAVRHFPMSCIQLSESSDPRTPDGLTRH
jgi:hypothetical protein